MRVVFTVLLLLMAHAAMADVIILDDGTRLEGTASKTSDGWIITDAAGHATSVSADRVQSFELSTPAVSPEAAAAERLASLRRAVLNVSDLHQIIDRYNKFIAANQGTPAGDDARADLAAWQKRLDTGEVKVGSKWVTADERDEIARNEAATAEKIRGLLEEGRLHDAEAVVKQALADDPRDPAAIYLHGVLLATQDQIVPARQAFGQVIALVPNHAPTLNNLAIELWKQKQYPAAMLQYDQAMLSGPHNQAVLDNVAEALNALPEENRNSPPAKKAAARFAELDSAMQKSQESQGLYRWGATWVTAKKLDELKYDEARNNDKLDALKSDFQTTQAAIAAADDQIAATNQVLQQIDAQRYQQDVNGNWVKRPLPPRYDRLQQELAGFTAAKQSATSHLNSLRDQAKKIEQDIPVPRYTGLQHLIGPEGTPLRSDLPMAALPPPAGAAPATRPAAPEIHAGYPSPLPATRP